MGDPIVISDDSDVEWSSGSALWHPPQPLDRNPGPSYGRGSISPPLATSVRARLNSPVQVPVTLTSPISPDGGSSSPAVNFVSATRRPLDLIDLTEDSDMMNAVLARSSTSVIDLTERDDDSSVTEIICIRSNVRRTLDINRGGSGSRSLAQRACSNFDVCIGDEVAPIRERMALIPERRGRVSVASNREATRCHLSQGSLSPIVSCCDSHSSLGQACSTTFSRDLSSFGSPHPASDITAISSASSSWSHTTTAPSMVENFHQVLFDNSEERSDEQIPQPIPDARVQIVINTIEANFPEATVQCLSEFVTPHFYPPREILSHLIRKILLGPNIGNLLNETFKLLTKIQELHPASVNQVEWDWELLTIVMQEKDTELPGQVFFLRYVLKTLEDDFQEALKQPLDQMQATIAGSVLSCDRQPHNIKDVIKWLVETLGGPGFPPTDNFPLTDSGNNQVTVLSPQAFARKNGSLLIVLYLQKMLAIAVEADRTPTCSSTKIAEMLFGFVLNIPDRNQRESFFTSMENHLLRCKVLEILLLHSCEKPTTLPLSFAQILYFLNNATSMYNQTEDIKWGSWDELVEHLQFLLISYQRVVTEHLRVSVKERKDASKRFRPQTQPGDDITALDIEQQIEGFRGRMVLLVGGTMPFHLQEKLFLLKLFLLEAIHGKPLLESRIQGGHLMRARSLLAREFPGGM